MKTNTVKDLMSRAEQVEEEVEEAGKLFPFLSSLESLDMTAAPELGETFTRSRVESSLKRPDIEDTGDIEDIEDIEDIGDTEDTEQQMNEDQDRFFYRSVVKEVDEDQDNRKMYDFNVVSRKTDIAPDIAEERSMPVSYDNQVTTVTPESFKIDDIASVGSVVNIPEDGADEDVIPIYLHIPRSAGCRKFCISIKVEITRTGRQLKTECRRSLVCQTDLKRSQ